MNGILADSGDWERLKFALPRIFLRTIYTTMENQYCKVGAVTPIAADRNAIHLLEYQYQNFLDKASNIEYTDAKLIEFFELKAQKLKKALENMMR